MDTKNKWITLVEQVIYGLLGFCSSLVSVMGYYPLVPAFFAGSCPEQRGNLFLYVGVFAGIVHHMAVGAAVKYVFLVMVLMVALRFFLWANRRCTGWNKALIAGLATTAMNCSSLAFATVEQTELLLGVCEGVSVAGATVLLSYVLHMAGELQGSFRHSRDEPVIQVQEPSLGKISAFAEAMDGLSVAFAAAGKRAQMSGYESVEALQQEIAGKLCADCDGCAVCWDVKRPDLSGKIRRMLQAVVAHSPKEEILRENYMEECPHYPGMVEEAIWAFSRMELNEAWYRRLQENRKVIAGQLDAMALTMQDWGKGRKCLDETSRLLLAKIAYEVRERGLVAEQVHIYEDEARRPYVTAVVSSKWGGGIPSRQYCRALERATGMAIRLQKDARTILTREPVQITAYEDTIYDVLSAVASETKEGGSISGDNVSIFTLEEGCCHICLSDGMGSGPAASKESDLVVDLMEKFMEAGFSGEAAIRIMNSAMVLKGEDESYSTLDFAGIDLYTGELTLTKIGAAASFLRRRGEVTCLASASLPAGATAAEPQETIRRRLSNGDFLVMVTDGVLEYLHVKKPEEKVAGMIEEIKTDNAGTLAHTLLEQVLLFNGGHAPDDMTIVVTGIWEK